MATKLREAEVAHFSLEGRNPPGPRQALTSLVLNRLIPGGMSVLRRVRPVWKVPGRDLVVVTGFDAVQEVFSRQHDFEVPYEERVELIHFDGFLLALQDTDEYHKMHDGITQLFCPDDTGQVKSIIRDTTADILAGRGRDLDLIQDLVKPVVLAVVEQYYGVPVPEALAQPFFDGNLASSGFVFAGPRITAKQAAIARAAVAEVWPVIDAAMDAARRSPNRATVLGRYYAEGHQEAFPEPSMRSALMTMIGGFLPPATNASGRIMEVLLGRTEAMRFAVDAARADQDTVLLDGLLEALRLDYIIPLLWRRAAHDTCVGEGARRLTAIRKGTTLIVSLQSAMLDGRRVRHPKRFDPYRSPSVRMVYGHQFHYCIGEAIANAVLVDVFKPLLKRAPRTSPAQSRTTWVGDYPWHLWLRLD